MCRWLTYLGPPILMEELIYEPEHSLIDQSHHAFESKSAINADGVGVGWYGEWPEPGRYRQVLPAWNDTNLRHLSRHIRSHLFFAHVRASTGTAVNMSNCHPFVLDRMMFMHNGKIGSFAQVRRPMEAAIPDKVFNQRTGTTDSEAFFLMMYNHDVEQNPADAFRQTIEQVETLQRNAGQKPEIDMAAVITDGKRLTAIRYSTEGVPPSLYWAGSGSPLTIASEPFKTEDDDWTEVPANHAVLADEAGIGAVDTLL